MTTNVFINNKGKKNGLHCIFIRLTHDRKHYAKSSGIYVKKNQFNKDAQYGYWVVKHLDRDRLNIVLKNKIVEVERMYQERGGLTPKAIINSDNFFKFAERWIEKYNNEDQMGTYASYTTKIAKLKAYGGPGLKFSDITVRFLGDYVAHLKTKKINNHINTIAVDLRKIRAIIRQAIVEDIFPMEKDPFLKISIETKKTSKEKLTIEELQAFRNVYLGETEYKFHARNVFLFCLNCMGMRIGDALRVKQAQLKQGFLHYQMNKTGKIKNIEFTAEAQGIVDFYKKNFAGEKYLFPYLNGCESEYKAIRSATSLINKGLVHVGQMAGIEKRITSHIGRHSFTKLALDSGIDMRTLQGMLDHSTIKVTEGYAGDIVDRAGNEALKKMFP